MIVWQKVGSSLSIRSEHPMKPIFTRFVVAIAPPVVSHPAIAIPTSVALTSAAPYGVQLTNAGSTGVSL